MKLSTEIPVVGLDVQCTLKDRIVLLGSCFSDEMGSRMSAGGFNVCSNPFGTLYNPASIARTIERLDSGVPFSEADCIEMGAGAGLVCSFSHHTSFARPTAQEFLAVANSALAEAVSFWKSCNKAIITLGTAFVWEHRQAGIVCNCLKRNAAEFTHYMLGMDKCSALLEGIVRNHPDKEFIFTVSPIRHLSQGAHENTLSKATLHLAVDKAATAFTERTAYFPAWEILNDELRDYRFYAEDLIHPSKTAVDIIWERFLACAVPASDLNTIADNLRQSRRQHHHPLHYTPSHF